VGISGDWIIFGVPGAESIDPPNYDNAGVVYLAELVGTDWLVTFEVASSTPFTNHKFGSSVAIDGNVAVVGTPAVNNVVALEYDGVDWSSVTEIGSMDREPGDQYGCSVSVDGDWVAVGALAKSDAGFATGATYIFHRGESQVWSQEVKIVIPGSGDYAMLGYDVGISATDAIMGSPAFASVEPGAAYVIPTGRLGHGDFNSDEFISAGDYSLFYDCLSGPEAADYAPLCACGDYTTNGRIDVSDLAAFQREFTGEP
jgi:hypothetical protein